MPEHCTPYADPTKQLLGSHVVICAIVPLKEKSKHSETLKRNEWEQEYKCIANISIHQREMQTQYLPHSTDQVKILGDC